MEQKTTTLLNILLHAMKGTSRNEVDRNKCIILIISWPSLHFMLYQKIPSKHIWWRILLYWQDLLSSLCIHHNYIQAKWHDVDALIVLFKSVCVRRDWFCSERLKSRIFAHLYGMYMITIQYMYHHIISCSQEYDS